MDEEATKAETANAKIEPAATESANGESAAKEKPRAHGRLWAIAALMCVVAIAAGTYLTYSAYKAGDFLKAVAATTTSQALFTSDLLNEYTSTEVAPAAKSIVVDSSGDTCSFTFRIYNCLLDNKNVFNSKDVYATLGITAENAGSWMVSEGSKDITSDAAGGTHSLAFPGYSATVKTFTVKFDKQYLDQAKFTVKAQVDTARSPGTNLALLAATIVPNRRADVTNASVSGAWVDSAYNVENYDAYNYRVTVTGKKTTVKLTWTDDVELDPFFVENHKTTLNGNSVTFEMEPGSQIINFFRKGSGKLDGWNDESGKSRYVTASEA